MKAIIAVNNKDYIGLNGDLPWKSSDDLIHFKSLTMGGKLLVGWKTSQTLPSLQGREVVILQEDTKLDEIDWCIGGRKTYEKLCDRFTELYISHINDDTIGDTFFPNLTNLNPNCKIYHYYFETSE